MIKYRQLSPCGHPTIMNFPIKWTQTAAKSQAKINYRCLTEINSAIKGVDCISKSSLNLLAFFLLSSQLS